jgi:hypothetical protein
MNPIPSGYIQLPLWFVIAMFGALLAIIGYVWHRMDKRVDSHGADIATLKISVKENSNDITFNTGRLNKKEQEGEESMKSELAKGGYLTQKEHSEMCHDVCNNIAKMLNERFTLFEKNLELQLDNIKLSLTAEGDRIERRAIKRGKNKKMGR